MESFTRHKNHWLSKRLKLYFRLNKLFEKISISIPEKLKLFDSMILPISNYGCEAWGFHSGPDIERVHLKFLKQILKVKTQTPSASIYGELGRVPLIIKRKERILKYWLKVKFSSNTLLQHAYINEVNIMNLSNDNLHVSFWSLKFKTLLDELGFSYLFNHDNIFLLI